LTVGHFQQKEQQAKRMNTPMTDDAEVQFKSIVFKSQSSVLSTSEIQSLAESHSHRPLVPNIHSYS
jgi:hypothetical protein